MVYAAFCKPELVRKLVKRGKRVFHPRRRYFFQMRRKPVEHSLAGADFVYRGNVLFARVYRFVYVGGNAVFLTVGVVSDFPLDKQIVERQHGFVRPHIGKHIAY